MIEIIQHFHIEEIVEHRLHYLTHENGGYSFDCDETGKIIDEDKLSPAAKENLKRLRSGEITTIKPPYVDTFERSIKHPTIGKCTCGAEVELTSGFGNDCECGKIYNTSGAELRPRSQWDDRDYDGDY